MTLDRAIGILSLIIGIPGFLFYFFSEHQTVGILCVFIAILIFCFALYLRFIARYPIILKNVEKTLDFLDPNAENAKQIQDIVIKANANITEYSIGNIASDGQITQILINNQPPDLEENKYATQKTIVKRFSNPKRFGEVFNLRIEYHYKDSFPSNREGLVHVVDRPTEKLTIIINYNPAKIPSSVSATLNYGGVIYENLKGLKILNNGRQAIFETQNLKLGAQYQIEWIW